MNEIKEGAKQTKPDLAGIIEAMYAKGYEDGKKVAPVLTVERFIIGIYQGDGSFEPTIMKSFDNLQDAIKEVPPHPNSNIVRNLRDEEAVEQVAIWMEKPLPAWLCVLAKLPVPVEDEPELPFEDEEEVDEVPIV